MGKKKKSIMDLNMNNQKSIADELYLLEKGLSTSTSIFDVDGRKKSKKKYKKSNIGKSGLSMDIERAIAADELENNPEQYPVVDKDEEYNAIDYDFNDFPAVFPEPYEEDSDEENEEKIFDNLNNSLSEELDNIYKDLPDTVSNVLKHPDWFPISKGIEFAIDTTLNRMVINDGVSPTTLSIKYIGFGDTLIEGSYDPDHIGEIINLLYAFIISSKHPTGILTVEEFYEKFKKYNSVNGDRFVFFLVQDYVLMYYVGPEERNVLIEIPSIYNMTPDQLLQFYITLVYRTNETHNIFFIEDSYYIESYRTRKAVNDYFMYLVDTDDETVMLDTPNTEKLLERLNVLDAKEVQISARQLVAKLTGDPFGMYEEDEEDDGKEEDDNADTDDKDGEDDSSETTEAEILDDEDDIDALLDYDEPGPAVVIGGDLNVNVETKVVQTSIEQQPPKRPKMEEYRQKSVKNNSSNNGDMVIPVMKKQR